MNCITIRLISTRHSVSTEPLALGVSLLHRQSAFALGAMIFS